MTGDVTIGIDIGTTSVKAVAADADGTIVARSRVPHEVRVDRPLGFEHDARVVWVDGVRAALAELGNVAAVAVNVAAMMPSLCAVDESGTPISPGLLYGDDRGHGAGDTGADPTGSGELLGFLRWTAEHSPGAHGLWPAQAVANRALGGPPVIDIGMAFSMAPLHTGSAWDPAVADGVGVSLDQLPVVGGLGEKGGRTDDGLVLGCGAVDAMCEQIVAGADDDGDVLVILGTTLLTWAVIPEWVEVDRLWTIPHLTASGKAMIGGASNAGGLFCDWVRRLVGEPPVPDVPDQVPVWVPYVRGERVPQHDRTLRASLHDAGLTHGPGAIRRSAYEACGFAVRHQLDLAGVSPTRIVATGGGTRVTEWVQALADATGLPVTTVAVHEGGALGSAWLARMAAGLEDDLGAATRWARHDRTVDPDPTWVEPCAERYTRYRALVP